MTWCRRQQREFQQTERVTGSAPAEQEERKVSPGVATNSGVAEVIKRALQRGLFVEGVRLFAWQVWGWYSEGGHWSASQRRSELWAGGHSGLRELSGEGIWMEWTSTTEMGNFHRNESCSSEAHEALTSRKTRKNLNLNMSTVRAVRQREGGGTGPDEMIVVNCGGHGPNGGR